MKKILTIAACALFALALVAQPAAACDGDECYGSGNFDGSVFAGSAGLDLGLDCIPNGFAGGIAGAGGATYGEIHGLAVDAAVEGNINVTGGGLYNQSDYVFNTGADLSIGVGSHSTAEGVTGGRVDLSADADCPRCFDLNIGVAEGHFAGVAGEGTLDVSVVGKSPYFFETKGVSGGIAGQAAVGHVEGAAIADDESWGAFCFKDYGNPDSAYADAYMDLAGGSYSESYRYVNRDCQSRTEGMGTNVGANTFVNTYGDSSRDGYVNGGFKVAGGAAAKTVQMGNNGLGTAQIAGSYQGAGSLNCNYTGSVDGYTRTSITTVNGMNGSIASSSAGMHVETHTGNAGR